MGGDCIYYIIFRFEHDDVDFKELVDNIMFILDNSKSASPANMFSIFVKMSQSKVCSIF